MPGKLINCVSLPPATLSFVPIYVFAVANEGFAQMETEEYFTCCGKCICKGCDTPYGRLETMRNVRFVILTRLAKQMKKWLRKY